MSVHAYEIEMNFEISNVPATPSSEGHVCVFSIPCPISAIMKQAPRAELMPRINQLRIHTVGRAEAASLFIQAARRNSRKKKPKKQKESSQVITPSKPIAVHFFEAVPRRQMVLRHRYRFERAG